MRSPLLDKYMKQGHWTSRRIYDRLETGSFDYLEQVLSGSKCPSRTLAHSIKTIVVPIHEREKVHEEDLFTLLSSASISPRLDNGIADDTENFLARKILQRTTVHKSLQKSAKVLS